MFQSSLRLALVYIVDQKHSQVCLLTRSILISGENRPKDTPSKAVLCEVIAVIFNYFGQYGTCNKDVTLYIMCDGINAFCIIDYVYIVGYIISEFMDILCKQFH